MRAAHLLARARHRLLTLALALVFGTQFAGSASAAIVGVTAVGQLDATYDPDGRIPVPIAPDATFSLSFTYNDNATLDTDPNPSRGFYTDAITSMSLSIGGHAVAPFQYSGISISNDFHDAYQRTNDIWAAYFWTGDALFEEHFFVFEFRDLDGTALNSQALAPVPAFPSTDFEWVSMNYIVIHELQTSAEAYANVDSLAVAPIPAAAWLLASALGALGWARRRAQK